jgi:hypothetical protein
MLQEAFCGFIKYLDYPADLKVGVSLRLLIDVIVRVDKRKVYYIYYHDMKINECKQVALYAYWLLRFRPFFIYDRRLESNRLGYCINELFAIFLIFAVLRKLYDINNIPFDSTDKNSYCYKLLYNFRFRHISIDEMILLIDSITKDTLLRKYEVD